MENLETNTAPYPMGSDVKNLLKKNGFTNDKLYQHVKEGLYGSTITSLVLENNINPKDIENLVAAGKEDDEGKKNLSHYVYSKIKYENYKVKEEINRNIRGELRRLISGKDQTLEGEIGDYIFDQEINVQDNFKKIIYSNKDLQILNNDPEMALDFAEEHKSEIQKIVKEFRKDTGFTPSDHLKDLGDKNNFTNEEIDETRCAIKLATYKMMQQINEKIMDVEKENILTKYSKVKSPDKTLSKAKKKEAPTMEMG